MRGIGGGRAGARRGQSVVELALLLPLLSLILIGAIDLGRVFIAYTRLASVAREGALHGSHFPAATARIRERAYANANGQLGTPGVDLVIDTATGIRCYQGLTATPVAAATPGDCAAKNAGGNSVVVPGDSIAVTARHTFRPLTTQLIRLLPPDYRITLTARMVVP